MNKLLSKQKILIIDDAPENIDVLGGVLSDYRRIVAINGHGALQKALSANPPDLILLDVMMPDMDGYEVCRRLKADERSKDIPVIFITAKGSEEDERRGFEVGGIDYISKPIKPSVVLARVKTHLELKLAREELERQNKELLEAARLREDVERITRHDLKNPLNAVIGYPEVIKQYGGLQEKQLKFVRVIEEAGFRMLNMINFSLDLFKMERGIYRLNAQPVDLIRILKTIRNEVESLVRQKMLSLEIVMNGNVSQPDKPFPIWGEELLCYSMMSNLVKNALEASPREERVIVKFMESPDSSGLIQVHNYGVVPEDIRDRFFEKYSSSGKDSGTGLGTYSAKLIVDTLGGSIDFSTSEEHGTTLEVRLPKPPEAGS